MWRYYTAGTKEQKYRWKEEKLVGKVMCDDLIMLSKSFLWLNRDLSLKTFRNCDREGKNFIYLADKSRTKLLGLWVTSVYFTTLSSSGTLHQGSDELYKNQPISCLYDRGHLVPVNILRYSLESAYATFTYTNCVPQIAGFNRGQWKKYETKIVQYAQHYCAPSGGTLYLITGTSQVKVKETLSPLNEITGVDKSVQPMEAFHDDVDTYPQHGPKILIPNSMWTVGCCLGLNNEVMGAFGVMGGNSLNQQLLNEFMMPRQTVASVQEALQLEDKSIKLFPNGGDCYDEKKNVQLNNIRFFYVPWKAYG